MGLGGDLMLSAAIREIKKAYPEKRVYLTAGESFRERLLQWLKWKKGTLSPVFENNPYLSRGWIRKGAMVIDRSDPRNHYVQEVLPDRYVFKDTQHVVELICRNFGVMPEYIKPDLFFSPQEEERIQGIARHISSPFFVVEPNGKTEFTETRLWFFDRWQQLVDKLQKDITVVQVGDGSGRSLKNVVDFNGRLTFREAAMLIGSAELYVGTVGGLMHAARAVDTRSVILYSGYESPKLAGYAENINIIYGVHCAPCGLRIKCPYNRKCMDLITLECVYGAVVSELCKGESQRRDSRWRSHYQGSQFV